MPGPERADVVVSWAFAPVPEAVKPAFTRPTRFVVLPTPLNRGYRSQIQSLGWTPIREIIRRQLPGVAPTRVALLGFSESCHGVREILNTLDGEACDAVVAIDGLNIPYFPDTNKPDTNVLLPWTLAAMRAVVNTRLFVSSYSSIKPPFAGGEETADWIWKTLTNDEPPVVSPPLPVLSAPPTDIKVGVPPAASPYTVHYPSIPWSLQRRIAGLILLGCSNLDPAGYADHIYQAKVLLPLVLSEILALRWNSIDPLDPDQGCFLGEVPYPKCPTSSLLPEDWLERDVPVPDVVKEHTGTVQWGDLVLGGGLGALLYFIARRLRRG